MRSRYHHDGSVDDHAHSEHEILRRADEALEQQRLQEHALRAAGTLIPAAPLGAPLGGISSAATTSKAHALAERPRMPHETLAAGLVPTLTPPPLVAGEHSIRPANAPKPHGTQ